MRNSISPLVFLVQILFSFLQPKMLQKSRIQNQNTISVIVFCSSLENNSTRNGGRKKKNLFVMVINNMVGVLYHRRGEHCNTTIREKVDPLCIRFDCICVAVSVLYLIGFGNAFFFLSLSCYFAMFFRSREKTNFLI